MSEDPRHTSLEARCDPPSRRAFCSSCALATIQKLARVATDLLSLNNILRWPAHLAELHLLGSVDDERGAGGVAYRHIDEAPTLHDVDDGLGDPPDFR